MFKNILGNVEIKNTLNQSIINKKETHSYMFIGTDGIGKKLIAREFAKAILCLDEERYCNKCKSCIEFDGSNNPDFSEITSEGNHIGIEKIREMQKRVYEKPIISKRKVYIIDNADLMTDQAQNCLLKTLEEPPEFVTIILIGSNENNFLTTIKSRCTIIHFNDISNKEIKQYLKENHNIEANEKTIEMCQGSIGKAIYSKDKLEQYEKISNVIENIETKDIIDLIEEMEILYDAKDEIEKILNYINVVLLKMAKTDWKYTNCIQIVENTKKRLKQNANYDMCIDNLLFKIWEEVA